MISREGGIFMSDIVRQPDDKIWRIILEVVKEIINVFKKPSEEVGKTDSINDDDSVDNIDRIIQIFSDFKDQVHAKAFNIERAISEEVNFYIEELNNIFYQNSNQINKYGINMNRINRQIDKISLKVKGTIDREISKKVTLDNPECKKIIKMLPGTKKERAFNLFLNESFKYAIEVCCREIRSTLEEIYEDVETEIFSVIEFMQKQNNLIKESIDFIDEDNYEQKAKSQIVNSYFLIDVCNLIDQVL